MKVTVIGLGPAGAMAAYQLARKGFTVEGVDLQKRYVKACGDALTIREEYQHLVNESGAVVTGVSDFTILVEGSRVFEATLRPAPWYIIEKGRLVEFLRYLAVTEGAQLKLGIAAKPGREGILVDTRGPLAHEPVGSKHVFVYRGIARVPDWDPGHALLDFLPSRAGLYWVFPADSEGRLVNFGAGFWGEELWRARRYSLERLKADIGEFDVIDEKGAPIAVWAPIELSRGGRLMAGEAAGLVNSLSGEGNRYALLSGMLLAEALSRKEEAPGGIYWKLAAKLSGEARLSRLLLSLVVTLGPKGSVLLESLPSWFWKEYLEGRIYLSTLARLLAVNPEALSPLISRSRLSS